ncbi:MAG: ferritin-like domain-containing protein [Rhizobiaceae bacterium]
MQASPDGAQTSIASLKQGAIAALRAEDLDLKVDLTRQVAFLWWNGVLGIGGAIGDRPPDRPGRPIEPRLVPPRILKKRSIRSQRGRVALLHAIAHIELNAIDLAWDIVARFADPASNGGQRMPRSFFDGWVRVALEEAKHFSLLRQRLIQLDSYYGAMDAHDGLWEAAQTTGHDLTARLAIVPLILEARGLDITPSLLRQMDEIGDAESAAIFHIIYRDEMGHVAVGAKWFRYLCLRQGVEPGESFQRLVRKYFRGPLKPPFNDFARCRAGLTPGFYRTLSSAGQ